VVLPWYAGPFDDRVDYSFNRALAHSAAGQRQQEYINKALMNMNFSIIRPLFGRQMK
jgi:hypothetical protein